MDDSCVFCKENRFYLNRQVGLNAQEAVIYEDDCIFVTPDLSPLLVGHLLIVSQDHFKSYANAPVRVINSLMNTLAYLSEEIFKETEITWFEHGAVFGGTGGASVNHAHLHIIPYDLKLNEIVEKDKKYLKKTPFSQKEFMNLAFVQPYLWIGNRRESYIYHVKELPSQYLRKKVMSILNSEDYNWKENYFSDNSIRKYRDTVDLVCNKRGK